MRDLKFLVFFLLFASLGASAQSDTPKSKPEPSIAISAFHEDVIAELTPGSAIGKEIISPSRLAWIEERGGKKTVRLDGKQQGDEYDDAKYLRFGRDDTHLAFFAKRNSKWVLVLDGKEHSPEYSSVTAIALQPQATALAYCACVEKKCRLVVNGEATGAEYNDISVPQYSADGKHLGYLAKRQKKWVAIVDGKEVGPEFDEFWYTEWGFAADGKRFYAAGRQHNDWLFEIDGTPGPGFDVISTISFSADGEHYAYGGTHVKGGFKKQKTFGTIVVDGKPGGTYEGKGMSGSWSSPAGGPTEMISPGVRALNADFHGVSTPQFEPGGALVYAARREKGDVAVFVGDTPGPGFDEILSAIAFARDEPHFAYVAKRGDDFVEVRDNKPGVVISASKHGATEVRWIGLSPDGKHLTYELVAGGQRFKTGWTARALRSMVVDGQKGPEYDALGISDVTFLPESRHLFYVVYGAKGNRHLVSVDGSESKLYDAVSEMKFSADGKSVIFIALDGTKFLRVSYALEEHASELAALEY